MKYSGSIRLYLFVSLVPIVVFTGCSQETSASVNSNKPPLSNSQKQQRPESLVYDLSQIRQTFMGFGAQIWSYCSDEDYPDLLSWRQKALEELNIKYVRVVKESASWEDLQKTRAMTDALGIKWVYMIWSAPRQYSSRRLLTDIPGFADWWVSEVDNLYKHNIPVEYIELMNEPDSEGKWSTGITGSQYNDLIKDLRPKLDRAGYSRVGIVGPGISSLSWSRPDEYIKFFDKTLASSMAAWSTHSWDDDKKGPTDIESFWPNFGRPVSELNSSLPKFVTEYATKQKSFHGIEYPMPDDYGQWDDSKVYPYYSTTNITPYAARVYANTFALLNSGANALFIWQLSDEPTEVNPLGRRGGKHKSWGLLDLWGKPKPVYPALLTLYPKIPIGSKMVKSPDQKSNKLYTGVLVNDKQVIIGVANDNPSPNSGTIHLKNVPSDLRIIKAEAFEPVYIGDRTKGEPDRGKMVKKDLTLTKEQTGQYSIKVSLPADSILTIICQGGP